MKPAERDQIYAQIRAHKARINELYTSINANKAQIAECNMDLARIREDRPRNIHTKYGYNESFWDWQASMSAVNDAKSRMYSENDAKYAEVNRLKASVNELYDKLKVH